MRTILPYAKDRLGQDTGYNCGPATVQTILSGHGIRVDESILAREMGTDVDGTDYVALLANPLGRRLPAARWQATYLPQDPPTRVQADRLWTDLVRSIRAGYGVAMNWVAPPGNYPRGILGSASPSYGGGTVFHYVAAMGVDSSVRAVWVVDSGFSPREYWVSFDQVCTLIPPKGYLAAGVDVPVPSPAPSTMVESRTQVVGPGPGYEGWPQLGGRTLVDAVGELVKRGVL